MPRHKPSLPPVAFLDATPQRLAQAANDNIAPTAGEPRRMLSDPIARLHHRGQLHPDPDTSTALVVAAERLERVRLASGTGAIRAQDASRVRVDGSKTSDDFRLGALAALRAAEAVLTPDERRVLAHLQVDGLSVTESGQILTGRGQTFGRRHAMGCLVSGLAKLAKRWGYLNSDKNLASRL